MKKISSRIISLILAVITLTSMVSIHANAVAWPSSNNIKTYVLSTGNNTPVYSSAKSYTKIGTINATDLITIKGWSGSRLKVTYPLDRGGTKTGYIDASQVLKKVNINNAVFTFVAQKKITAYRRPSGNTTTGWIDKGDKCWYLCNDTSSGRVHVIYPLSNGYKMGWINATDLANNSGTQNTNNSTVTNGKISFSTGSYVKIGNTKIDAGSVFYTYSSNGTASTNSAYRTYPYVKVNGVYKDTGSTQCMAYARYIQELLYGVNDYKNSGSFNKTRYRVTSHSTSEIKNILTNAGSGSNIRVNYSNSNVDGTHSLIVLKTDSNGVYITDANGNADRKVRVLYLTWQQFKNNYKNIYCVSKYKG